MNLLLTSLLRRVYSAAEWEKVGNDGGNNFRSSEHLPVMLAELLHGLGLFPGALILDCTVGYCGHAEPILEATAPSGVIIGIDRDPQAIESDRRKMSRFGSRLQLVHGHFMDLKRHLADRDISKVHGVLFDLGVSSPQLDEPSRGFSFQSEGPLDMRMDPASRRTAADIVNGMAETDLADLIFQYGEERYSRRIARSIVRARQSRPLRTTRELVSAVEHAVPHHYRSGRIHPATRTFQALRIVVNQELEHLEMSIRDATDMLAPGGRLCVISFHSLEDRIVKRTFRSLSGTQLDILTKKPQLPGQEEARLNPRSRSAKLRVAERRAQETCA